MINYIKNISSYLLRKFKSKRISYSQTGIDLILNTIFKNQKNGFYVDVGCNHPVYNNNTYLLFKRGWHGINIDLDKDSIQLFNFFRKKDLNINCAVSSSLDEKDLYFYHSKSPINTLDKNTSLRQKVKIKQINKIKTNTLNNVLENSKINERIDVLCIDVEGHELEVMKGFDIKKYLPKVVVIEFLDTTISKLEVKNLNINNVLNSEIYKIMIQCNYTLINWHHSDLIFAENSFRD